MTVGQRACAGAASVPRVSRRSKGGGGKEKAGGDSTPRRGQRTGAADGGRTGDGRGTGGGRAEDGRGTDGRGTDGGRTGETYRRLRGCLKAEAEAEAVQKQKRCRSGGGQWPAALLGGLGWALAAVASWGGGQWRQERRSERRRRADEWFRGSLDGGDGGVRRRWGDRKLAERCVWGVLADLVLSLSGLRRAMTDSRLGFLLSRWVCRAVLATTAAGRSLWNGRRGGRGDAGECGAGAAPIARGSEGRGRGRGRGRGVGWTAEDGGESRQKPGRRKEAEQGSASRPRSGAEPLAAAGQEELSAAWGRARVAAKGSAPSRARGTESGAAGCSRRMGQVLPFGEAGMEQARGATRSNDESEGRTDARGSAAAIGAPESLCLLSVWAYV